MIKFLAQVKITQIIPKLSGVFTNDLITQIIDQVFAYKTFGIRYDIQTRQWKLITNNNLDIKSNFSLSATGDTSNQQLDSSWLLLFETDGETYEVSYRAMRYIFESESEIKFYYDGTDKIYDSQTGKIIKDKIAVLSVNTQPDSLANFTQDWNWQVSADTRNTRLCRKQTK